MVVLCLSATAGPMTAIVKKKNPKTVNCYLTEEEYTDCYFCLEVSKVPHRP